MTSCTFYAPGEWKVQPSNPNVMKHSAILLACAALLAACQKDIGEEGSAQSEQNTVYAEEAFPGVPKESVTLPGGLRVEKAGEAYVYQGDILLTPQQAAALDGDATRGAATTEAVRHWPQGRIPYYISPSLPNPDRVTRAVNQMASDAKLSFQRLSAASGNCVRFVRGTGNSSYLGRKGGVQDIEVSDSASVGVIMHEICHAAGLFHEHSRTDRDAYVRIFWSNVQSGKEGTFDKYADAGYFGRDIGAFDFGSLMMLPQNAFSTGGYTIGKLNGSTYTVQRQEISFDDLQTIGYLYGPPYVKITKSLYMATANPTLVNTRGYKNIIYFYSDAAMTGKVATAIPRRVLVRYDYLERNVVKKSHTFSVDIPAYRDSYELDVTLSRYSRPDYDSEFTMDYEERLTIVGVGR